MNRYVVKWQEKVRLAWDYPRYMDCEEECSNKKEATELFDFLSDCEKEGLVRNVSLYDKASKKTIKNSEDN